MSTITSHTRAALSLSFQRTSVETSSSRVSLHDSQGTSKVSRCGTSSVDHFAPGGCFPSPVGGPQQGGLEETLSQLFQEMANFFQSLTDLLGQSGQVGCQPRPPPDCTPPPHPRCPPRPPHCEPHGKEGKTWDVFFDAKSGTKTAQKSPIVLDLNGNGKADITGSNIKGNGKLEGKTVKGFDLDPSNRQWTTKSVQRRPGNGAPALPAGTKVEVFDAKGNKVKTLDASALNKSKGKSGDMGLGLSKDMRAEFRGPDGKLVGELKTDKQKNQLMYHFGNVNENEWTQAWDSKTGGDGILAWDVDGDGKITSGKEIFGHVDLDGTNRFSNGYEKLAKYFDKDGNGRVEGSELQGLKIWEDRNGDGVTDKGELVDLGSRGIQRLSTRFNAEDMSSTFRHG
ncbi:hypothetical protein JY651_27455 [Pyxidicoccus parkwayensis]|uniref:Uncharacterized protein n=1 Tax=Pyxidicoccus parkwayensis TaxID=2813578 RepID=A0ABX7NNP2_9BACT|nr:hypothetical protein [Pyxidicoccus parkwaysis]QSQ19084.1 hypothetical protein JY651_27455 [Pyxidicoccus parkwaysis]